MCNPMVAHIDQLPKDREHYLIRLFDEPVGEVDLETGQPWKKYAEYWVLSVLDGEGELQGVRTVPPGALHLLRDDIAKRLNLKGVYGYRWINGKKRRVIVPLGNV